MAASIFHVMKLKTRAANSEAHFISISVDEVTTIDNSPWLSIYTPVHSEGMGMCPHSSSVAAFEGRGEGRERNYSCDGGESP